MTKKELIARAAEKAEITFAECEKIYDAYLETFKDSLAAGEDVTLAGFGGFAIKRMPERMGRNLRTGEKIVVPAHSRLTFKPGKALRDCLQK